MAASRKGGRGGEWGRSHGPFGPGEPPGLARSPELALCPLPLRSSVTRYSATGSPPASGPLPSGCSCSCSCGTRCRNVQTLGAPPAAHQERPPTCSGSFSASSKPRRGNCRRQRSSHSRGLGSIPSTSFPEKDASSIQASTPQGVTVVLLKCEISDALPTPRQQPGCAPFTPILA